MAEPFRVLVLNPISTNGLKRLPAERYLVGKDVAQLDAVLVRSADMHALDIPARVLRIGKSEDREVKRPFPPFPPFFPLFLAYGPTGHGTRRS